MPYDEKLPFVEGLAAIRKRIAYKGAAVSIADMHAAVLREAACGSPALHCGLGPSDEGTGIDFAHTPHAAQCPDGDQFATFDKPLARDARKAGLHRVVLLK